MEDLKGKKVGSALQYRCKADAWRGVGGRRGRPSLAEQVEAFKDILLNRLDAVFVDFPVASYYSPAESSTAARGRSRSARGIMALP